MKIKIVGLILAFCCFGAGAVLANPFTGTWKLDAAKSKMGKGAARNNVVNYESEFPFKTKVLVDGVDVHGHPYHSAWEGRFDGKDYPVTGDANADSRAYTKVNENTVEFTSK